MTDDARARPAELRTWVRSWSGTLAAGAAAMAGLVAADPAIVLAAAELIPEGWPRGLFVIAIVAATYGLPLMARTRDRANDRV